MALSLPVGTKLIIKHPKGRLTNGTSGWDLGCNAGEIVTVVGQFKGRGTMYNEYNLKIETLEGIRQIVPDWAFDLEEDSRDITDWL